MRPRARLHTVSLLFVGLVCGAAFAQTAESPKRPELPKTQQRCVENVLGKAYPLEACLSFPGALLHWLDSLGNLDGRGLTAGKTVTAHRRQYANVIGAVTREDQRQLKRFAEVRIFTAIESAHEMTAVFFGSLDVGTALARMKPRLDEADHRKLDASVRHFATRYAAVWNDGALESAFLEQVKGDRRRTRIGKFLAELRRFYGAPATEVVPRLILVPVPAGAGTHAQAIGRDLLIEIRPGDTLADEVPVIVHENSHFLYYDVPEPRRNGWDEAILRDCDGCEVEWRLMLEALPTALGQGVATRRFGRSFRLDAPWYHRADVDALAKQIYPAVTRALEEKRTLDAALFLEWLRPADSPTP